MNLQELLEMWLPFHLVYYPIYLLCLSQILLKPRLFFALSSQINIKSNRNYKSLIFSLLILLKTIKYMNRTQKQYKQSTQNLNKYQKESKTNITFPSIYPQQKRYAPLGHVKTKSKIFNDFNKQNILNSKSIHLLPMNKEYSFLRKYENKMDSFLQMQTYFNNVYNQKKNKRMQKQFQQKLKAIQKAKNEKQNQDFHLPLIQATNSILQKQQFLRNKIQIIQNKIQQQQPFMPYPLYLPMNDHNSKFNTNNNFYYQQSNHNNKNPFPKQNNQDQNQQKLKKSKESQKRRKMLLRKFRIYGYAVYFAMLLPQYSLMMAHYRLTDFISKYLSDNNKTIQNCNQKLLQQFSTLQFYGYAKKVHQKSQKKQKNNKQKNGEAKIKIFDQVRNIQNEINLVNFKNIMVFLLQKLYQSIDSFDDQIIEYLSICSLDRSYFCDQILANQQALYIVCDKEKCFLRLNEKQQDAMIISNFIIKKFIYHFLVRITADLSFQEFLREKYNIDQNKKEKKVFDSILKQIELISFFLYVICDKKIKINFQNKNNGNMIQLQVQSMPLTLNPMQLPALFQTPQQRQNIYLKSTNQQNTEEDYNKTKSKVKKNKPIQKTHSGKLQDFVQIIGGEPTSLIHNIQQFGQLMIIISYHMKSLEDQIGKKIDICVQKIKWKMKQLRKKKMLKTKQKILSKKKNILTKDHQVLQGIMFLRTDVQKQKISQIYQLIQILRDFQTNPPIRKKTKAISSKISIISQ